MGRCEAVVFDLDGTLLDTLEDLTDSVNAALEKYHYPQKTIGQIRSYVGNGIHNLIMRSLPRGEENPDFEGVFQTFRSHYKDHCQNKTKIYRGIEELLYSLKKEGIRLAIVSNKADFAVKELNQFYFKDLNMTAIGEREGIARKPAPDSVYQALKEIGASPDTAVYVGDSEVDILTAANASIPCISVLWGFRSREVLEGHHASYFAETADDVYRLIHEIFL